MVGFNPPTLGVIMKIKELIKLLQDPDYNENDEINVFVKTDKNVYSLPIEEITEFGMLDEPHICVNLS